MLNKLKNELRSNSNKEKIKIYERYFKTGKGEYGEGDKFLGVTVPTSRKIAKKYYREISWDELTKLISSEFHEERFTATEILYFKYKSSNNGSKKQVINFYLKNLKGINNWDLVDNSAYSLLGDWLLNNDRKILYSFSQSSNLWERRIAIIATYAFIKNNDFKDTIKIANRLLNDEHELIHKAVGWMVREVGKRDKDILDKFLEKNYKRMPRTMLRYAIEKFPEEKRQNYLKGKI